MGVFWHNCRTSSSSIGAVFLVALLLFVITSSPERDKIRAGAIADQIARHHRREGRDQDLGRGRGRETSGALWVRRMVGPGSSPPTCRSKCGRCEPCRSVHVPIHPGRVSIPMEYYPEAWRCKCGNTLFMP